MDMTVVLTGIGVIVTVIGANIALMAWLRADMKTFEQEVRTDIKGISAEIRGFRDDIQKEIKDFHGRLCMIEERFRPK